MVNRTNHQNKDEGFLLKICVRSNCASDMSIRPRISVLISKFLFQIAYVKMGREDELKDILKTTQEKMMKKLDRKTLVEGFSKVSQ